MQRIEKNPSTYEPRSNAFCLRRSAKTISALARIARFLRFTYRPRGHRPTRFITRAKLCKFDLDLVSLCEKTIYGKWPPQIRPSFSDCVEFAIERNKTARSCGGARAILARTLALACPYPASPTHGPPERSETVLGGPATTCCSLTASRRVIFGLLVARGRDLAHAARPFEALVTDAQGQRFVVLDNGLQRRGRCPQRSGSLHFADADFHALGVFEQGH